MKKLISIISALVIAAGLTACSNSGSPSENISDDLNSPRSETSSQSPVSSQSVISSEGSDVSSTFPEKAAAPDGGTVNFSEAVKVEQTPLDTYTFDYAFVRLAEGTLCTTNEDPGLYDWTAKKFAKDLPAGEPRYTRVKAGDTLADGFTVIGAYSEFNNNPAAGDDIYNAFIVNVVNFGNENTELTGYLRCVPYAEETVYEFYADPSQSDPIPVSFCGTKNRSGIKIADEEEKFAAMGDGAVIKLKIPENTRIDLSKIVPNKFIKAKVKVSGINAVYYVEFINNINAVLDELEIL